MGIASLPLVFKLSMFPTSESTFILTKPAIKRGDAGDLYLCHMMFMAGTLRAVTVHLVLVKLDGFMFVSSVGQGSLSGQPVSLAPPEGLVIAVGMGGFRACKTGALGNPHFSLKVTTLFS